MKEIDRHLHGAGTGSGEEGLDECTAAEGPRARRWGFQSRLMLKYAHLQSYYFMLKSLKGPNKGLYADLVTTFDTDAVTQSKTYVGTGSPRHQMSGFSQLTVVKKSSQKTLGRD
ncbi:hypothetical protein EVAR_82268_1 [Eumeta japonica]|uniref:Uncharacterized protein n=1 Tax=Eumeta variegata TaxID=151549 RepID=A0A4C1VX42_EUMVA|nr:hypothetical protein EVAR_82268_1 [Eumeta japonica]